MRCAICGITVDSVEEAIDQGWIPYFYDGEKEHEPACPGCSVSLLQLGEDGEMEVKEKYRGKIKYHSGDFIDEEQEEHRTVGIVLEYCEN